MQICMNCKSKKITDVLDLNRSYIANELNYKQNQKHPLRMVFCQNCKLFQLNRRLPKKKLFNKNYPYLSSTSRYWLSHCEQYSKKIIKKLKLNNKSKVIEIASNDGYLLKFFKRRKISVLGIEPTSIPATLARKQGINVIKDFFSVKLAKKISNKHQADLIVLKNVMAHVPDINDFTSGLSFILKKNGTITIEFPHVLNLIKYNFFDTIYHEHYTYLSISFLNNFLKKHKLKIYDVEKIKTHGGSLRIYLTHKFSKIKIKTSVKKILEEEKKFKLEKKITFKLFQSRVKKIISEFKNFLKKCDDSNQLVFGYAAAAKTQTFLSTASYKSGILKKIIDKNKLKIGKKITGTNIIIHNVSEIKKDKPMFIILFAWNLISEIKNQLKFIKKWNGKIVTFIPDFKIHH